MSIELNFFPVLGEHHYKRIGYEASSYQFSYRFEGETRKLDAVSMEEHGHRNEYLKIIDEKSEWVPDFYELLYSRKYIINSSGFLFGPNGLACKTAELGLALLWTSKTSNQRSVEVIGGFRNGDGPVIMPYSSYFNKGHLKGSIGLQTILYIKEPGTPTEDEQHLANESGVVLGALDEFLIYFDGNGSAFPVVEVQEPSQPLWWVQCDWVDPLTESFDEESVRICLNKSHSSYKLLNIEGGLKQSPLFKEILSSAFSIIIQKAKSSDWWEEILNGQHVETGSVAQAIRYFIEVFEWDVSSPERLALTIRRDLDGKM